MPTDLTQAIRHGDATEIRRQLYAASITPAGKRAVDWAAEAAAAIIATRGPFDDLTRKTCWDCERTTGEPGDNATYCQRGIRWRTAKSIACVLIERKSCPPE